VCEADVHSGRADFDGHNSRIWKDNRPIWRQRGRYAHMEVGHVGQNIHLQAEALGLGTVVIGAFMDDEVAELLHLPKEHEPLYVMPVGYIR